MYVNSEMVKDFKQNRVWKVVDEWINTQKDKCKNRLLEAKPEEVIAIQKEYKTYNAVQQKIEELAKKG